MKTLYMRTKVRVCHSFTELFRINGYCTYIHHLPFNTQNSFKVENFVPFFSKLNFLWVMKLLEIY